MAGRKKQKKTPTPSDEGEIVEIRASAGIKIGYEVIAKPEGTNLVISLVVKSSDPDNPEAYSDIPRILSQPIPLNWLQASKPDLFAIAENMLRDYHRELGEALRYEAGLHLLDTVITALLNRDSLPGMSKKAALKRLMEIRTKESRQRLERLIGIRPGRRGRPPEEKNRSTVLADEIVEAMKTLKKSNRTLAIVAKCLDMKKPALQKRIKRADLNWKHLQTFVDRSESQAT